MLAQGRLLRAVNPNDPKQKPRPAVVLWVQGDKVLVAFGQTFDSVEGEPAFVLDSKPHRGIVRHPTHFYANDNDMVILPVAGLNPSSFTLTKDEFRLIGKRMAELGYPPGLAPPAGAAQIAPPQPKQPPPAPPSA